jgi:hypothetical protein
MSLSVMPDLIRHPEPLEKNWIPAFAGMTTFWETVSLWTDSN